MRHRKAGRKLGMDSSARKAMYRNMVTSLFLHGQITTTAARAKELRRFADRIVTIGKKAPTPDQIGALEGDDRQRAEAARVHAYRRARLWINNDEALANLFGEYALRFRTRPGGYTRVVKAGWRPGDNAPMAVIQLVEALDVSQEAAEPIEAPTQQAAPEPPAVADAAPADAEPEVGDADEADLEATEVMTPPEPE